MELNDYEHKRRADRQMYVKIHCEQCKTEKWVRWTRVQKGQGRFCSLSCYGKSTQKLGKGNVYFYFDSEKGRWIARWRDEITGEFHIQHRSKFIWEQANGSVPNGFDVHHIDENRENDSLSNLEVVEGILHKQGVHGSDREVINHLVHKKCFRCEKYYPENIFKQTYCPSCWKEYQKERRKRINEIRDGQSSKS